MIERRDKHGRLRIWINEIESRKGFEDVASFFESEYDATVTTKLDSPDSSRIWDLTIRDTVLTLVHDDLFGNYFYSKRNEDEGYMRELVW